MCSVFSRSVPRYRRLSSAIHPSAVQYIPMPFQDRLIDDERMEGQRHDPSGFFAVLVELIKLVDDHLVERFTGQALADEQRYVVEFDRVGYGHHPRYIETIWLVVRAPVQQNKSVQAPLVVEASRR